MLSKEKLKELLDSLRICVNEGIQNDRNAKLFPRLVYFENEWSSVLSSGDEYQSTVTYQVSFFSKTPRHTKLLELKNKLADEGLIVPIFHEYVESEQMIHSTFVITVLEDL
ncbi:hypothetical protein PT072_08335 [Erysipelothrix rhusiopathiae]|nr:hypothetical protein [Erysipelothrix rhusiopathiae]